jgi:non-specific protein-tyrosine kinase
MTQSLITLADPRSAASEAYRTLRSNLMFAGVEKPVHAFVVASPNPNDGKSLAAANLAVVIAQGGRKTILVDCDLRRPVQHTLWGLENMQGVSSAMLDQGLLTAPPLQKTNVENLSLLPSGQTPPNPADLIISSAMDTLIGSLRKLADFVIFDVPPILSVSDAPLLASRLDGCLLILKAGVTRRDDAQRAKEILDRAHVRVIGAALINAPKDGSAASY